ncbi:uncharacterized protein DS421_1g30510 [Arachis hypogaea]|nr:uncharacterized protein DS421_1g30510 [Arachis hypogaea]
MSLSASYNHNLDGSSKIFTNYNRAAEIEKHCSSHLPLASKLSPDDNRGIRIKSELSFTNGDWEQEDGHATLMSFEGHGFPTKLVTFKVMDISSVPHFENTVCLGGIMSIGISSEGVYLQTNDHENGKEHLLCLLGNTTLPISKPFIDDWNDYYLEYSLLEDDHILLVLQYPQSSSLKRRAIRGEMQSLNQEGSLAYFDNVHISSQLNGYANVTYQFSSELNVGGMQFSDIFTLSKCVHHKAEESHVSPMDLKTQMSLYDIPYYKYSKVELAAAIKKKNQPSKLLSLSKKSLKLNELHKRLDVYMDAIRHESSNNHNTKVFMEMDVLSPGASYSYQHEETTELVNISLQLTL